MQGNLGPAELKTHLKNAKLSEEWLFQVHVIQRRAHLFSLLTDGLQKEMDFRRDIADSIGLAINEVGLVGSAQIGYSIKPYAKLREMDAEYKTSHRTSDMSDVDVAIVSRVYFEKVQREMHDFTKGFEVNWQFTKYYPTEGNLDHLDVKRADHQFYRYLAQGWIRPDFCPNGFNFGYIEATNKWKKSLGRKISIGIYRDWRCLRDYQQKAFKSLRDLAIKDEL